MKIQPKEWEKIFTNHISHKQLISKICKELIQLYTRKKKKKKQKHRNLIRKLAKVLNKHFSKEDI